MSRGDSSGSAKTPRLRMSDLRKSFGATHALRRVSFELAPGEVHALIGENGAGKSTLMKILSGAWPPDSGRVELDGVPFVPEGPLHARRAGISMIYQELNLAPHLSVEENILLGSEPHRFGWIDRARRRDGARTALAELGHDRIPLDALVASLPIAEQQIVEIARALVGRPRVLIMDEPTSSLTRVDVERLFEVIAHLKQRGVAIVYISHFLEECRQICDRYTVLRDGESVGTGAMAGASIGEIIHLMVGREIADIYPRIPHTLGEPVMEVEGLVGTSKPRHVTFTVRAGEILGIAGLVGAGRTETLRACFGLDPVTAGDVRVFRKAGRKATPTSRLASGIGLLSENRKEEGLMLNRTLAENLLLTRFSPVSRFGFIQRRREEACTRDWMKRLDVRSAGPHQAMVTLSGGNQQKLALGRLLHHEARILLLDEPTRGIDVGSKSEIYRLIGGLAAEGRAIVFVSSYLPELLGVCDTIGVMCRGVLSEVRPVAEWTEHDIIAAAVGQSE